MWIFVITPTGKTIPLEIENTDPISMLIHKIQEKADIPVDDQDIILLYDGSVALHDCSKLHGGMDISVRLNLQQYSQHRIKDDEDETSSVVDPMKMRPWAPWVQGEYTVHSMSCLRSRGIRNVGGLMKCCICCHTYILEYDAESEYERLSSGMAWIRGGTMTERQICQEKLQCPNCIKLRVVSPVIEQPINWMFLALGNWLGFVGQDSLIEFAKANCLEIPRRRNSRFRLKLLSVVYQELVRQMRPTAGRY